MNILGALVTIILIFSALVMTGILSFLTQNTAEKIIDTLEDNTTLNLAQVIHNEGDIVKDETGGVDKSANFIQGVQSIFKILSEESDDAIIDRTHNYVKGGKFIASTMDEASANYYSDMYYVSDINENSSTEEINAFKNEMKTLATYIIDKHFEELSKDMDFWAKTAFRFGVEIISDTVDKTVEGANNEE